MAQLGMAPSGVAPSTDEMQALSRVYGNGALVVLVLDSGNLAIFGNDRQLIGIWSEGEFSFELLREISAGAATRLSPAPVGATKSEKSLDDLGI